MTPSWALVFAVVYVVAAFGLRTLLHRRRSGDTGFRGHTGRRFSAQWWAVVLFVAAVAAVVLGPVAALAGLPGFAAVDQAAVHAVGIGISVVGFGATLAAQTDMGTSWRIGVQASERTELVTTGLFAWVRNPIFTAMVLTAFGLFLWTANTMSLTGVVLLTAAAQLQVRAVEEPYLHRIHGQTYRQYTATVGRFVPTIGCDKGRHVLPS